MEGGTQAMATIVEALRHGLGLIDSGDLAGAERIAREVLTHEPLNVDALHLLGLACRKAEKAEDAVEAFRRTTELRPDRPVYHFELGIALKLLGDLDAAYVAYGKALELDPTMQQALVNAGAALDDMGRHEEALVLYLKALDLKPRCVITHLNIGNAYQALGNFELALDHYDRALSGDPENSHARWNRAMANLRCGRFQEGWQDYEWRTAAGETKLDLYPQTEWDGSSLAGKTLLVHAEQGVGDEILFASCYHDLIARARQCVFVCEPRLAGLFRRSFPQAAIYGHRRRHERNPCEVAEPVDFQIAAGSIPRFLRGSVESFPQRTHYLLADAAKRELWKDRLDALGPGLKIGISWRAGGKPAEQARRTTGLFQWRGLLSLPGTHFVNLQYGDAADDIAEARDRFGVEIHDWPDADALTDLDGLAAQIAALDLVIAVGNTTVHLAGSLGVPAWSLLPANPSWRWMSGVDAVPWYSSVRLFRQSRNESWKPVFDRVRRELGKRLGLDDEQIEELDRADAEAAAAESESTTVRLPAQVSGMKFVARLTENLQQAVKHHQAGELAIAENIYREVLKNTPQHADALHLLGVICQQTGRSEQAIKLLRQAIALCDDVANFHFHLALALRDAGQRDEAMQCYTRALELKPDFAEARLNLGAGLQELGRLDEAIECYRQALADRPEAAGIHLNLGVALRAAGSTSEAQEHLREAIRLQPGFPEAQVQLGQILQEQKQFDEAIECFHGALEARPDHAAAHRLLGKAFQDQQRLDEAIVCYQRALELKPGSFDALANLGMAFQQQGQFTLAADHYEQALRASPDQAQALFYLSNVRRHLGQLDQALACCERLLELAPKRAEFHLARAKIWLEQGDFPRGWDEFQWRRSGGDSPEKTVAAASAELAGASVRVRFESGLPDQVLFASCLPDLLLHAGRCAVECHGELEPLLARSFPTAIVRSMADEEPDAVSHDVRIDVGSLPRIYRPSAESFPRRERFLVADRARTALWRERLDALGDGPKIGLQWRADASAAKSGLAPAWDHWRPLVSTSGAHFVSLAGGTVQAELETAERWGATVHELPSSEEGNLDDLAARIAALDLVISIDDLVAHLAGGLGASVWTLIPNAGNWRWTQGQEQSLWYPSMRLFRSRRPGAWPELMQRVSKSLADWVAAWLESSAQGPSMRRDTAHKLRAPEVNRQNAARGEKAWP